MLIVQNGGKSCLIDTVTFLLTKTLQFNIVFKYNNRHISFLQHKQIRRCLLQDSVRRTLQGSDFFEALACSRWIGLPCGFYSIFCKAGPSFFKQWPHSLGYEIDIHVWKILFKTESAFSICCNKNVTILLPDLLKFIKVLITTAGTVQYGQTYSTCGGMLEVKKNQLGWQGG